MKILAAAAVLAFSASAHAATVSAFAEDFEGTLAAWTDRTPWNPQSAIVVDPLNSGNHVLGFSQLGSAGSIFTSDLITTGGNFTVSFDYLGLARPGSVAGNLGGFFGISQDLPGAHYWVAGTGSYPAPIDLIDDGVWHTYTLTFASPVGQQVHLMFEDYSGSGGVVGDVYFDNVRFNDASLPPAPLPNASSVPEPGSLALAVGGLLGVFAARRRKTR